MANSVSAFYQTLTAAATEASQALVGPNSFMDAVFLDYKSEAATIGQTLNVPIPTPVTGSVTDGGVADPTFTDIAFTTEAIVMNKHPYFGYIARDFEQFNSPLMIRQIFLDAAIKGVVSNIDQAVAGLFTSGNFTTNAVQSTTGSLVTTAQFLAAKALLLDQLVPADDPENMTFIQASVPYTKMLGDGNWTQQSIASELVAEEVRRTGRLQTSYGATIMYDPYIPISGSAPNRTFTGAYFHRWSVAVATRPLPPPDAKVADFMYIRYKGVPIRITLAWTALKNGWVVMVEGGYGLKVVRENMGVLFSTAE